MKPNLLKDCSERLESCTLETKGKVNSQHGSVDVSLAVCIQKPFMSSERTVTGTVVTGVRLLAVWNTLNSNIGNINPRMRMTQTEKANICTKQRSHNKKSTSLKYSILLKQYF